jgi:DNA-binding MarR family transcriptional regulator
MNLNLAHALLVAADGQPYGFLKVRSADLVREVEQMAAAGLVDASLENADNEAYAVINRVTDSGHSFLRTFKNQAPPLAELVSTEH